MNTPHGNAYEAARRRLVDRLVESRVIRRKEIRDAFLSVPRELFVPPATAAEVYADTTIPIHAADGGWMTTSSQPAMMAIMLEQLDIRPGQRVLEIGAGSGYNAALLSRVVGPAGCVDSVEVTPDAAAHARESLAWAGITANVHTADGADGWPAGAPYDRLISTVAVWDVPRAWMEQCAPDARMVVPITVLGSEYSTALEREGEGWVSCSLSACAFVRFQGRMSHPDTRLVIGDGRVPSLVLTSEPGQLPNEPSVRRWLETASSEPVPALDARGSWDGFVLWLLASLGPRKLFRAVAPAGSFGWDGPAVGLWDEEGMAVVAASGGMEAFGGGNASAVLRRELASWTSAGRPADSQYRLRLGPGVQPPAPGVLPRWQHTLFVGRR